ncbi:MAG: hypothetical protein RR517_30955, partial [Pseudomonas sp.]
MYYDRVYVGKTHANPLKIRGALAFYQSPLLDTSMSHFWQKLAFIPSTCWFYQQKSNSFNIFAPSSFAHIKMIGLIFLMMKSIFQIWY